MANPHHRKKKKHFTPPPHRRKTEKGGAASIMAVFGGITGLAVTYFAMQAAVVWLITGTLLLALIGYLIGRWMDASALKKK